MFQNISTSTCTSKSLDTGNKLQFCTLCTMFSLSTHISAFKNVKKKRFNPDSVDDFQTEQRARLSGDSLTQTERKYKIASC